MVIEQGEFLNVSHLLWHGTSVYNGHLREPLTLTCCQMFVSVTTCLKDMKCLTTEVRRHRDSNKRNSAWEANAVTNSATAVIIMQVVLLKKNTIK